MRSSMIKSCLLALATASTVVAQIAGFDVFTQPTTAGSSIPAGKTYTIKWTPSAPAGKVSIYLLEGASNTTLQIGPKIATSIDSVTGSYDWAVPSDLPAFPYFGFKLALDSDPMTFQYSTYFSITGLAASSSSSEAVSTTTVASSSVTVVVSQVSPTTSASTTTISTSLVTVNSTVSASSTPAGVFPNSTMTTTTSKAPTGTASTTSASASSSSGANGRVIVGGTSLLGAFFVGLGMLL